MNKLADKPSLTKEPTHLLWTGGWDSTFRLLQLLLIENNVVQPHYMIIPQECAGKEIDTIHNIRREISRRYSEQATLLKPIEFLDSSKVAPDEGITEEYKRVKAKQYISGQYEVLARYCKEIDVNNMELSVLNSDRFGYFKSNFSFLKYFDFPLLGLTKPQMFEIAQQNGWADLMRMTWFCRRPKNGRPCGFCGPCTDAVIAGMGWRLPLKSRLIANIQLPFRKWWRNNYQKQNKGLLKYIPIIFKNKY